MSLEDIINVVTTISVSTIAEEGFSVPLILAHHNYFADPVRTYKTSSFKTAMATDGFPATHAAYRAALALAKQNPVGTEFKVGKRTVAETQVVRLTPEAQNTAIYSLTLESPAGVVYPASFTSDANATLAEIATGLTAAINTATGLEITASGASGTYVALTAAADEQWSFYNLSSNLTLTDVTATPGGTITSSLNAIKAYDNDWYGLVLASSSPLAIKEAADWIETERKIFVANTHDQEVFVASEEADTDVFSVLDGLNYVRTHVTYNSRAGSFYGGAWLASIISYEPGKADWMFKTIAGAVAERLTEDQAQHITDRNGSFYSTVYKGKDISGSAQGGTGIFLDLVQLSDWARARAIEAILVMLTSSPKVAHTDQGAGNAIWGAYKGVIDRGIDNEAISGEPDSWSITVPKRAQLSANDRSQYRWPGTSFSFTPTGAVHSVGTVTITLNVA
jgi:Protein of unknown function (DUF3383)